MFKSNLIAVPVTALAVLVTGLLSELCCCASPAAAVLLGLFAGALCAQFEKPGTKSAAIRRGAIAGAVAGIAALPAQALGEIVVALLLAGSGKVDIAVFGLPDAHATVDLWNWALNAVCAAGLYGLTAAAIMAATGAVGGALWLRFLGKAIPPAEPQPAALEETPRPGKFLLAGAATAGAALVYFFFAHTTWGCMAIPAAALLGLSAGVLAGHWGKPRTAATSMVNGALAGWIASFGALLGDIFAIFVRTFLITTPEGVNSMNAGLYGMFGWSSLYSAQTPLEMLGSDFSAECCCCLFYFAAFAGFGALGGWLWRRAAEKRARAAVPPSGVGRAG